MEAKVIGGNELFNTLLKDFEEHASFEPEAASTLMTQSSCLAS
jgi:hypothetical protein